MLKRNLFLAACAVLLCAGVRAQGATDRKMRDAGLIEDRRQGQNIYYWLKDQEVRTWLEAVLGPAAGELPSLVQHKRVIACPCPKCSDDGAPSEV